MSDEPMTREQYAEALSNLDGMIGGIMPYPDRMAEPLDRIEDAIVSLTEATIAVAKGIRLLAEPPPVEVAEEAPRRGAFTLIEREGDPD